MTAPRLQKGLQPAVEAWKKALGDSNVSDDELARQDVEQCTFPTDQRIPAIIYPASTAEVQTCVQIANDFHVPVYPISRGRNWGLGPKVPVRTGCVLMDLHRMNRITEFNDEHGYVAVQPGVTFQQVSDFLVKHGSHHFLPTIGGPPDSSVLGNFLERGDGAGPMGQRALHACGLEVVLGRGEIVHTGYGQFAESKIASLDRCGVGPSLDGLFTQSNFGITTKVTMWLCHRPYGFQPFLFTVNSETQMRELIPKIRVLQKQGVIQPSSISLWNRYKLATSFAQHPTPTSSSVDIESVLAGINPQFKSAKWFGIGTLFGGSRKIVEAQAREVRHALRSRCNRLLILTERKSHWLRRANNLARLLRRPEIADERMLQALVDKSVYLGNTSRQSIQSLYWRKTFLPESTDFDPHADRCGVHWICHSVPFTSEDFESAEQIVSELTIKHGLEPSLIFVGTSQRFLRLCLALHFDRDEPEADANAQKCHDQVVRALNSAGYTSCRLGIQAMSELPRRFAEDEKFLTDLKSLCDPNGIIAPGRYVIFPPGVEAYHE